MSGEKSQRGSRWLLRGALVVVLVACGAALLWRTPLQSRYWAWRLAHASDDAAREAYLGALASAGDAGRWGIAALLDDPRPAVRQYGVVALQHGEGAWSHDELVAALGDPDADIRRLAAAGVGMRADETTVRDLTAQFGGADAEKAQAACLALAHVGTDEAVAGLVRLAEAPLAAERRGAVLDALRMVARPGCVPGLLAMLEDERRVATTPLFAELRDRAIQALLGHGYPRPVTTQPAGPPDTIGERAAAALRFITGVEVAFDSEAPEAERAVARAAWEAWYLDYAND